MKKSLIAVFSLIGISAFSQTGRVGINTETPQTTLDISGKKDTNGDLLPTDMTGLQAPRLTRAELTAKGDALYGTNQKGTLIYITDISGGDFLSQRINITSVGYYYFDGTEWKKMSASSAIEPWYVQGGTNQATSNADHIYQNGRVGIGNFATASNPLKQLEVKGNFKAEVLGGGNVYGMEIDHPLIPGTQTAANYWLGGVGSYRVNLVHSGAAVLTAGLAGVHESIIATDDDRVTLGSRMIDLVSKSEIRSEKTGQFFMEAYNNGPTDYGATVSLLNDGLRLVHSTTEGAGANWLSTSNRSEIMVQKENGVRFNLRNAAGTVTGEYWFPKTTGTNGQVMTQTATGNMIWATPTLSLANNGLTKNGTTSEIELGGTLNRSTTIATVNGATTHPLNITGLPTTGATTDRIIVSSTGGQLKTLATSAFATSNIYTGDGSIVSGNRTVTVGNNSVSFTGNSNSVVIANNGTQGRLSATGTVRGSLAAIGGLNSIEIYADNSNLAQINASGTGLTGLSLGTMTATPLTLKTNGSARMTVTSTGDVAIGTTTAPSFTVGATTVQPKLHIAGDVSTTGKYYTTNSTYADYVFEKYFNGSSNINPNYEFKSLNYVKDFIKANNHLPGVESINDLAKTGNGYTFDMTKLAVQSLEKIEELYLHTIEQQDKMDAQQLEINQLKKEAEETKQRLEKLEKVLVKN